MTGILPHCNKIDAKATEVYIRLNNECNKRNVCFIDNANINSRYNCNKSGIYLSKSGTNNVVDKMLFALGKFDYRQNAQVSMNNNIFSEISNSKQKKLYLTRAKIFFKTVTGLRSKHSKNVYLGHNYLNSPYNFF